MENAPLPSPWIRRALVIFPAGLLLLGTGSMIWHVMKKEVTAARSIRYAAGLAREINGADIARYEKILNETLDATAVASFVESTLGPENMGYNVRKLTGKGEAGGRIVALDIELTGTQKPRDIVLLVTHHLPLEAGPPAAAGHARATALAMSAAHARATALAMSAAHALTGTPVIRSLRLVSVESLAGLQRYYELALRPDERVSHVVTLGQLATLSDAAILETLRLNQTGTVVEKPDQTGDAVVAAARLKGLLLSLADRL